MDKSGNSSDNLINQTVGKERKEKKSSLRTRGLMKTPHFHAGLCLISCPEDLGKTGRYG